MADTSAQLRKGAWARTVYSEKRKEQNRIASKVYRENRKRKLQMLNTVIALPTLGANSGDSQSPTPDSAWSMSTDFAIATNHSKHLGPHFLEQQLNVAEFLTNKASAAVPSSETQAKLTKRVSACFLSLRTDQRRRLFTLIRENGLKFVDTLRLLLDPRMNTAESDSLAIYGLFRDIDAMSKLPDLHVNNFHILQASYFAAIYANAQALGFQFDDYLNDDSVSPLTCIHASTDDPTGLRTAMAQYASAPRGLQPQETQIIQTHHPYLDVIPFPEFRARLLAAISVSPPLIDEADLCTDLTNDGMICWGCCDDNGTRSEARVPWDSRSWEPKPWFLRKYWFLVGEKDGEMWSASRWWSKIRGDELEVE